MLNDDLFSEWCIKGFLELASAHEAFHKLGRKTVESTSICNLQVFAVCWGKFSCLESE